VYAVGAVDYHDDPLPTTRPQSLPRLVAHGLSVVNRDPLRAPGHSLILTGTSMAAAEVSGIAGAVWGYIPELTPHQLMEAIYSTGVSLGTSPTTALCLGSECEKRLSSRVTLCHAASKLSQTPVPCTPVPAHGGTPPTLPPPSIALATYGPPPVCFGFWCFPGTPRTTGPQANSDLPWVAPQPVPFCPSCLAHRSSKTISGYIQINNPSLGIADADLFTSFPGGQPVRYLPVDRPFYTSLGGATVPATPSYAGLMLYSSVFGTFWGGSGVIDVSND
jgi:hypothetical protein